MADAAVSLSVAGKKAVLEPDVIYRIGRKPGLEFFIPDESMELAHATISLLRSGIVRFAAVVGKIWVNEQEQTFVDLSSKDTTDGQNVKLRFGNVEAQLEINEPKDKSINTTVGDSFVIPETEPQSANTTSDSCFIPETQAMPQFNRPSTAGAKRSLGDDFMIPETQDILAPQPVEEVAMEGVDDEDECSEMGTQIRICTQDFNDFDEDAIDDFDSSLILGDIPGHLLPAPRAPIQAKKDTALADITDVEMSALNWSAVNSTKMDQVPGNQVDDDDHDGTRSTPDLFEFTAIREDRGDTCTPDLFDLPAAPVKSNSPTSQPSGTKQLVVATIERNKDFIEPQAFPMKNGQKCSLNLSKSSINEPTKQDRRGESFNLLKPSENEPNYQDFIETQAFPIRQEQDNSGSLPKANENEPVNQDFIETQAFPIRREQGGSINMSKSSENDPNNQDFIETQAFPIRKDRENSANLPKANENEPVNQDYIETQAFPRPTGMPNDAKCSKSSSLCQDFIATQPFPVPQKRSSIINNKENTSLNVSHADQDLIATQKYVPPAQKDQEQSSQVKESKGQKTKAKEQKDSEDKSTSQLKKGTKGSGQVVAKKEPEIMVTSDLVIDSSSMEEEVPKLSLKSLKRITTTKVDSSSHGNEMTEELATTSKAAKATARAKTEAKKEKAKLKEDAKSNEDSSQEKEPKGRKKKVNVKEKSETKNIQVKKVDKIIKKEELPTTSKRSTRAAKEDPKNESETTEAVIKSTTAQESEEKDVKGRKLKVNVKNITSQGNKQAENGEEESKSEEKSKNEKSKSVKKEEPSVTNKRGAKATKDSVNSKLEPKTLMTRRSRATADPLQAINLYVKSKKAAGKIKIALSMCNLLVLEPVFKALKNAIEVTGDPEHCHLLIMDKGERTFKFLMAIAANKPILSTQWLHSLMGTRSIHVHAEHLFKDAKFQELYNFKPELVMEKPMILQNIDFMLSDGILPNETEMKAIIQSAGGRVHARPPPITRKGPLYVVTSIKLVKRHKQLLRSYENVIYIKTEGVMQSLLQHNAEHLNDFQLKV
ncbi:uncharacterized protein Dwil_GK12613 [Drosophila willistoni]|uniref:Uncharacterized protein n=1 Tax=Drosophila willistoni TaxID=7260 RepID=B4N326_DROWI|nr:uncharacterized protein Dwil_GK12613 [Drosophila willistoni]